MLVKKCGRTAQFTRGVISGIRVTACVNYGWGRRATFKNQILIRGSHCLFSNRGDSGSLIAGDVCTIHNRPIGLLFAGNTTTNTTIANPICNVLRYFRVRILWTQKFHFLFYPSLTVILVYVWCRDMGPSIEVVLDMHEAEPMKIENVTGIGIGEIDGEQVIAVYVTKLTPEIKQKIPKELEGWKVIIEEVGEVEAY